MTQRTMDRIACVVLLAAFFTLALGLMVAGEAVKAWVWKAVWLR